MSRFVRIGNELVLKKSISSFVIDDGYVLVHYHKNIYTLSPNLNDSIELKGNKEVHVFYKKIALDEFLKYNPIYSQLLTGVSVKERNEQNEMLNRVNRLEQLFQRKPSTYTVIPEEKNEPETSPNENLQMTLEHILKRSMCNVPDKVKTHIQTCEKCVKFNTYEEFNTCVYFHNL
jgi:hypothetical protein